VAFDPTREYPLGTTRPDLVTAPGGRQLSDVTLQALREGDLRAGEPPLSVAKTVPRV
jgi:propanediol dehydratase small subunit